MSVVSLKISLAGVANSEVRRTTAAKSSTFDELDAKLRETFPLLADKDVDYRLTWTDEDGDEVWEIMTMLPNINISSTDFRYLWTATILGRSP